MIDTTGILVNQVNNLDTDPYGRVSKQEVIDLIYGISDDIEDMENDRAFHLVQHHVSEQLSDTEELIWELEDMEIEDDPSVAIFQNLMRDMCLSSAENYYDNLSTALDVLTFERQEEQDSRIIV